ncbi:tetratricopeptide repeat protein [Clostridium sp. UBA1652]|uniref:tetratricopeptide repeat protein n=1 Tax=Clostridium sp. UBA1652 TaxID=1946348 RepID=UPI00257EC7D3|nr:tetratricopeptide repeat protein [Clostridium sp. UBA1652]
MAINSKFTIGKTESSRFYINKNFTDRDLPKKAFKKKLDQIIKERYEDKNKHHILTYYGIGGVGKSSLQKELKKQAKSFYEDTIYTSVDLANIPNQSTSRMLLELSMSFSNKNIQMTHFSIAYALYFQKSNKDILYNHNKKVIFDENLGIVADVLSVMDGLGILGIIPNMVNKLYELTNYKLNLDKDLKEDLKRLELMDVADIENLLPEFWAYDIRKYIESNKDKIIVVFLDTYEALWSNDKNEITKFSRDEAIRKMISKLPGVLFVISGRESLEWSDLDSDWKDAIEQHKLERLDETNAHDFLKGCNIIESDIRDQMIKVSFGHPYYLDLLVDTYVEIKNSQVIPTKELFATNKREILECFFRYLQEKEIEAIKLLSVTRYYNYSLFCHLLSKLPIGYPITKFEEFNKLSFVNQLTEDNYHIHELMQKEVIEFISPELYRKVNLLVINYYNAQITDEISYEKLKLSIKECIYHYSNILEPQLFQKTIVDLYYKYFKIFQNRGESLYLHEILNKVYSYLKYDINEDLFEIYSDMIMLNGKFKEAVNLLDKYLEEYDIKEISQNEKLLQLYVKKAKHQMTYESIDNTLSLLDSIESFIEIDTKPRQYAELIYTRANMLLIKGSYDEAKGFLDQVIDIAIKYCFYDLQCRALRKIADYYLFKKEERKADAAYMEGTKIAKNYGYERYAHYLECTRAEIYRKLKLFEQARKTYTRCCENFQALGVTPWVAHTNLGLALIEIEKGNYSYALKILEKCMDIYIQTHHTWGKIHVKIIQLQCRYLNEEKISNEDFSDIKLECKKRGYITSLLQVDALEANQVIISNLIFL